MTVAVVFGGRSSEHKVSIATGVQILNLIKGYSVVPIYIGEDGVWRSDRRLTTIEAVTGGKLGKRVHLRPRDNRLFNDRGKAIACLDAAVNCCHGLTGEDGVLQGVFRMSGIPLTGSDVAASAVGMDKNIMKKLFAAAGLPIVEYLATSRAAYEADTGAFIRETEKTLGYPVIVKPANLGSSIGIAKAGNAAELSTAMRIALEFDNTVVVERALENFVELNCAALGRGRDVETTEIEQPVGWTEFLKYEDKYLSDGKSKKRLMPAPISDELRARVQSLTVAAFTAIGASGVARVDFMLEGDELYVNEINTVPGSLSYYLFDHAHKLPPEKLIDRLIEIAVSDVRDRDRLRYAYGGEVKGKK